MKTIKHLLFFSIILIFSCKKDSNSITECNGGVFKFKINNKAFEGGNITYDYNPTDVNTTITISNINPNSWPLPDGSYYLSFSIPAAPYTNNDFLLKDVIQSSVFVENQNSSFGINTSPNAAGYFKTQVVNNTWEIDFSGSVLKVPDSTMIDINSESFSTTTYNINTQSPIMNLDQVIQSEYNQRMMQRFTVRDVDGNFFSNFDHYGVALKGEVICSNFDYWEMEPFSDNLPKPGVWGNLHFSPGFKDDAATESYNLIQLSTNGDNQIAVAYRAFIYLELGSPEFYYANLFQTGKYIKFRFDDKDGNSSLPITVIF